MEQFIKPNRLNRSKHPIGATACLSLAFLLVLALLVSFAHQPSGHIVSNDFFADLAISSSMARLTASG